ncbi:hypothetical protein [Actinomadura sp. NPDC049753]|uniref:hypothetical protein n=1 Tax=Actinomadura sp. NPDC049753 TaxID=3154739 RepID=UPI00341B9292
MTVRDRVPAIRTSKCSPSPGAPDRADHEQRPSNVDAASPAVVSVGLPAPAPRAVQQARAFLTPRHATGVDEFLWQSRGRPMPDRDAIGAVLDAGDRAQHGNGDSPEPVEVAAALLVLGAVRLNLDQTEARLLSIAQAAGLSFEQIAAVLGLGVEEAEERYRQLKPRLDEPAAPSPAPPRRADALGGSSQRSGTRPTDQPTWEELDDEDWGN